MSRLPKQVLGRLSSLPETDRKIHAQELMSKYEARALKLNAIGSRLKTRWIANQAKFLIEVSEELKVIRDTGNMPKE